MNSGKFCLASLHIDTHLVFLDTYFFCPLNANTFSEIPLLNLLDVTVRRFVTWTVVVLSSIAKQAC